MTNTMSREVLVLNKGWTAVGFVSLERAIVMLFSAYKDGTPKARIIDPTRDFQQFTWADWSKIKPREGENVIRTARDSFAIPEIIFLTRYDKLPMLKANFSRRTLFRRDSNQCQYCGTRPGSEELTLDHIVPRSRGGKTTWENVVCACVGCNSKKADRTPAEAGMKLRTKPVKPTLSVCRRQAMKCESWKNFISEIYWECELENDNKMN
jgi:5-methylcytosine-specific restriction endonuclease McrA